jgi:hypothetical protein
MAALYAVLILLIALFPYHRVEADFAHASRRYEIDEHGNVLARVVKRIEGTSDTLQLLRGDLFGEPYYYRLLTNAFSMSATNPRNQRYMRLFAYLPLALRPESEDVLLLCYGCGVTADAFLHGPNVKRMDVVDISKKCSISLISTQTSTTPTRCATRARTHSSRMAGSSSRRARSNTT